MSSNANATATSDNMSQVLTETPTDQSLQVTCFDNNIQAMNPLQPVQYYQSPDSYSIAYHQETVYSFFYTPSNDFQIYHITCKEIPLSFELVSQLINNAEDNSIHNYSQSNNIYVFYHEQPETEKIYRVTCEMIPHTFIYQFLNKIIYGNQFTQCEHQQQEFSNRHQENLKFHLKRNLTHYLVPKQTHEQNYDLFYKDYYNYLNMFNIDMVNHPQKYTNILPFNQSFISQQDSHFFDQSYYYDNNFS
jgi:hypothetical protein